MSKEEEKKSKKKVLPKVDKTRIEKFSEGGQIKKKKK